MLFIKPYSRFFEALDRVDLRHASVCQGRPGGLREVGRVWGSLSFQILFVNEDLSSGQFCQAHFGF